jgi:VWFA-related protein
MLSLAHSRSGRALGLTVGDGALMTHRSIRVLCGLVIAAVCLAAQPGAQEPPQTQAPAPIFRGGIDSVSVDVIVTDRQGRPVTNLTAQDFDIREEGRPQAIETFKLIQTPDGHDDPGARRDILSQADHERELARDENRVLVIFLDDYHTRVGNSFLIRERLAQFVSQLGPNDLVALTTPLLPASALTFSRNHDATAGQVMAFMGRKYNYVVKHPLEARYSGEPPAVQERLRNLWTIAGLRGLCEYMGSLRNGRKTILYVGEGMTNTMPAGVLTGGTAGPWRPTPGEDPTGRAASAQYFESVELLTDLQKVFNAANRTNTAIYTVDPRGLGSNEYSAADVVSIAMDRQILNETISLLRTMADQTDGRAIVNRNDPIPALQQMIRDSSTYYLIGYTSSSAFRDGKFHEIQVRVKRPNVEVRARKGYWALSPDEIARATAAAKPPLPVEVSEALDELASAAAGRRQPVSLWLGATRGAAEKAIVTLVWEAAGEPGAASERVDHLTVTAHSIHGDTLFTGRVERDPQALSPAGLTTFEAPAGSVRVRVDVENATGRRLESREASLEVPDFTSTTANITTPFVYRGRTARDLQQVRAAKAPLPTTVRAFSRTERLLLRFDAYGPGGTTPTLTMKVLNQQGTSIATMPAPARTTGQTFESEFSLSAFPPGDYLIEIAAEANGETIKKLVAIRVTGQ